MVGDAFSLHSLNVLVFHICIMLKTIKVEINLEIIAENAAAKH